MKMLLRFLSVCVVLSLTATARAETASSLAAKLQDPDATVRRNAADQLGELGLEAKSVIPELIKALDDKDFFVRRFAAKALGQIGPDAKEALPALGKLAKDERKEVAEAAATALGKIGGTGSVKPLIDLLEDKGSSMLARRKAIESLAAMGPEAKSAVKALIDIVTEKNKVKKKDKNANTDNLRTDAVVALGAIGPDASAAVPALTEIATAKKLKDKALKKAAADALKKIDKK